MEKLLGVVCPLVILCTAFVMLLFVLYVMGHKMLTFFQAVKRKTKRKKSKK